MVIDTSALIAIALGEPSRKRLLDALETAGDRVLSSMSLLEAGMVLRARLDESAVSLLYQLVDELVSEVVPFDEIQARLAIAAFGRFGKGALRRNLTESPVLLGFCERLSPGPWEAVIGRIARGQCWQGVAGIHAPLGAGRTHTQRLPLAERSTPDHVRGQL